MGRLKRHPVPGARGSVLLSLVVTIVVFAALGSAIVSLYGTAQLTHVGFNSATRAYYLAESAYRYATGEYLNTGDGDLSGSDEDDRNDTLDRLHAEGDLQLAGAQGRFAVKIYGYYVVADGSQAAGGLTLSTRFAGAAPTEGGFAVPGSGRLRIGNRIYDYTSYLAASADQGSFSLGQALEKAVADGTGVYFVGRSAATVTMVEDGSLTLSDASFFPLVNGNFRLGNFPGTYRYRQRSGNVLSGIRDRDNPQRRFSILVSPSLDVPLEPVFQIQAAGTAGTGSVATTRQVDFFVPVPTDQTIIFQESFDTDSLTDSWQPNVLGSQAVAAVDGDQALTVTGTAAGRGGAPKVSLIAFKPSADTVDLAAARSAGDDFLSYDAQVKVGFTADGTEATDPYDPDPPPVPRYFTAGLSFRLDRSDEEGNHYGLSLVRGNNSIGSPYDNLPDGIVPQDERLLLVLWQQTDLGSTRTWLAYKDLTADRFYQDTEDLADAAIGSWTRNPDTGSHWRVVTETQRRSGSYYWRVLPFEDPVQSWYFGRPGYWDYDDGALNESLVSAPIGLCDGAATVHFWSWYETEASQYYDRKSIYVITDGGTEGGDLVYRLNSSVNPMRSWERIHIDLSAYAGRTIRLRFEFNTIDSILNDQEGWYIDDLRVDATGPVTLAARLQEGPSIGFDTGTGTAPIQDGDWIVQSGHARARVAGAPIVSSGSWSAGTAAGTLILEKVDGAFQVGPPIDVVSGSTTAKVTAVRGRDNYIRAYLGSTGDCGGNTDGTDTARLALSRGSVQWPSPSLDDWPAENDYFTLVDWDGVNTGVTVTGEAGAPWSVVRSGTFPSVAGAPELGLHALGHGAPEVFFDDFAVQTTLGARSGLPYTVQR